MKSHISEQNNKILFDWFSMTTSISDTSDIIEKYRKGLFSALPEPELINSLLDIKDKSQENYKNEE